MALLASCIPSVPDNPLIGHWRAELAPHAMYEATVYEFNRDGTVGEVDSIATYYIPEDFAIVVIYSPSGDVRCGLEGNWETPDATTLLVDTFCSDGHSHRITFEVVSTSWEQVFGARLLSVDGEGDWWPKEGMGSKWPWSFTRCKPRECLPTWDIYYHAVPST